MWLQMGPEKGAPLLYSHQVKHMWVGHADGQNGTSEDGAEADEQQARAQVLTAREVEPKQALLWMLMQPEAQVATYVDSTSQTVEWWGPTRQELVLALCVRKTVRRSRGTAGDWDPNTKKHEVKKVMAMVDYGRAGRRTKGHTIQVESPEASGTGATDQGVTDLVQDGLTWWVVEPRRDRRAAIVYTAAALKRVEHPLLRWVGKAEEVRVETADQVRTWTILRALGSQMGRSAEAEEAEDIREQVKLALKWVDNCKQEDQPRWMVPPGTEEGVGQGALARARQIAEDSQVKISESKCLVGLSRKIRLVQSNTPRHCT